MKKLKHLVISTLVAIVASINVYIANNVYEEKKSYSLLNLENIVEASESSFLSEYFSEGWWSRKDWRCEKVVCKMYGKAWDSYQIYWEMGKGTNAHPIICPGC